MFTCRVCDNEITVALDQDLEKLYINRDSLIHLGDYDKIANGLYLCRMSRGDLYKKYSSLDCNLIDFAVPQSLYDPDNRAVTYYGEGSGAWGRLIYDQDILRTLAQSVREEMVTGRINQLKL